MTKMIEDMKFSDSYSKKELLEAIECLQHNYKGLKETYNRAVYVNKKLAVILDSCKIKIDWIKLEVIKNKQIDIKELIPFMRKGWVACNKNGTWYWYSAKPKIWYEIWDFYGKGLEKISGVFNIAPAKDWKNSLIKVGGK